MVLRLVKSGVPWEVAWSLSPERRLAYVVVFGELESGLQYDWKRMRWPDPPKP